MKKKNLNYSQLTIIIIAFVAITFAVGMFTFTPSFAQKAKPTKSASTAGKKMYKYKIVIIDSNGMETVIKYVSDKPMKKEAMEQAMQEMNKLITKLNINVQFVAIKDDSDDSHPETDFEDMLSGMEKDGLIDRSAAYKIKKEDNGLYINDKKQPASVMDKYSKYVKAKSVAISGNKGALSIAVNDD